jgi:hypothetical protein
MKSLAASVRINLSASLIASIDSVEKKSLILRCGDDANNLSSGESDWQVLTY